MKHKKNPTSGSVKWKHLLSLVMVLFMMCGLLIGCNDSSGNENGFDRTNQNENMNTSNDDKKDYYGNQTAKQLEGVWYWYGEYDNELNYIFHSDGKVEWLSRGSNGTYSVNEDDDLIIQCDGYVFKYSWANKNNDNTFNITDLEGQGAKKYIWKDTWFIEGDKFYLDGHVFVKK